MALAEHRATKRLIGIGGFLEVVEHDVVGRVVGLADLLQDHRALALQLLLKKGRALQDVGNDVEGERRVLGRSEEHTSELQSLMRISYAVFCLKKKTIYKSTTVLTY